MVEDTPQTIPGMTRSDSSSASSVDHSIHAPIPIRPGLLSRRSSGTMIVPRDSLEVGPVELEVGPNDVRAMSPRRSSQDLEVLGKEAREELQRSVAILGQRCRRTLGAIICMRHSLQANTNCWIVPTYADMQKRYKTLLSRSSTASRPSRKSTTSWTTIISSYRNISET